VQGTLFFTRYKISSVIISSETLELACAKGSNLWEQAENKAKAIFLSPKQLRRGRFEALLRLQAFWSRLSFLCFDEIHFLDSWARSFHPNFLQISNI
jgi:superfamily II DNA helicase RecQ